MRIVVLGATGRTGREILELAVHGAGHGAQHRVVHRAGRGVGQDHGRDSGQRSGQGSGQGSGGQDTAQDTDHDQVVAVCRPGSEPAVAGVTVARAALTDVDALAAAMTGADVVVSALGGRGRGPTSVATDGHTAALAAMRRSGVRRLVVTSAGGLPGPGDDALTRWVIKPIVQRIFRHPYADLIRMEQVVRASDVDWTIVRPARLLDGPATGRYRSALDRHLPHGHQIRRADLATALLAVAHDADTVGHLVSVAE